MSEHDQTDEELQRQRDALEARRRNARARLIQCLGMDPRDAEAVLEIYDALLPYTSGGNRLVTAKLLWRMGQRIDALERRVGSHTHQMPRF